MMTGDKVSATDAEKMGMIYKVFATDTFEEERKKIAAHWPNANKRTGIIPNMPSIIPFLIHGKSNYYWKMNISKKPLLRRL